MPVQVEAASERARARVGTVLKQKWHLDQLLGVGGMAAVYAATHRNKKRVAIKMLHDELSSDEGIRKRFLREGYIANSVGQRGAVAVHYDDVSEDGLAFLVMELLEGETIEQRWLRNGRIFPAHEALSVVDQLLDTLAAAHARGVIHRDLKPQNLFLTRDGTVKVLDFGIARVRELSTPLTTLSGSAIGTPAFMSPEQARGRWDDVDGRSDLWSVGATLYTLLTGKFVHPGETAQEMLALAATRPARSIGERRPDLHPALVGFVDKALSYDRASRFSDAATMQQALRVTYVALDGSGLTQQQPAVSDLQSKPGGEGVSARTAAVAGAREASGHPAAHRSARSKWLWGLAGFIVTVVLLAAAWPRSTTPVPSTAASASSGADATSPGDSSHAQASKAGNVARSAGSVAAAGAPNREPQRPGTLGGATGQGIEPRTPSTANREPAEPKAVRVDELPRERALPRSR